MHPHRGFQTVTYMLGGAFKHEDTMGNSGVIETGDIQFMTAGRGIVHSEKPVYSDRDNWGLQLWVNLKAKDKMCKPDYQDTTGDKLPSTALLDGDVEIKVIAGESHGLQSPIKLRTEIKFVDVRIHKSDVQFVDHIPKGWQGLVFVISGNIKLRSGDGDEHKTLGARDIAVFREQVDSEECNIVASASSDSGARFVLIAGENIKEPVARYGPFVMNTQEEIMQAFSDYQSGKLDKM